MTFRSSRLRSLAAAALVAVGGESLAAHDLWMEPTAFFPDAGKVIGIRLRIGQDLIGDPLPRDPDLIDQFIVDDSSGRRTVVGRDGADPAGLMRVSSPGLQIIGYSSRPNPIVLGAAKFNQYLRDEGLDAIAALRAGRRQTDADAREIFARCAKSLVLSGPVSAEQGDHALGFTLELVAEKNPYTLAAGDELPVRLTYQGRPLAHALVAAVNRQDPAAKLTARSDGNGRVRFRLAADGLWLIKAVHMIEAPSGAGADWASYWASLTFELKAGQIRTSK